MAAGGVEYRLLELALSRHITSFSSNPSFIWIITPIDHLGQIALGFQSKITLDETTVLIHVYVEHVCSS